MNQPSGQPRKSNRGGHAEANCHRALIQRGRPQPITSAPMETPTGGTIELPVVLRFVEVATDALAEAREEIDALNVYPVPDGDTGTNMYLTVTAAREAITDAVAQGADLPQALAAFGRGALLGARGNSGVILSPMLGAIGKRLAARGPDERNATVVAEAMRDATTASYAAVGQPVEGTMLSVAAAAATA